MKSTPDSIEPLSDIEARRIRYREYTASEDGAEIDEEMVVVAPTEDTETPQYHSSDGPIPRMTLLLAMPIRRSAAEEMGFSPCPNCFSDET